jgi:hypothetical protein
VLLFFSFSLHVVTLVVDKGGLFQSSKTQLDLKIDPRLNKFQNSRSSRAIEGTTIATAAARNNNNKKKTTSLAREKTNIHTHTHNVDFLFDVFKQFSRVYPTVAQH